MPNSSKQLASPIFPASTDTLLQDEMVAVADKAVLRVVDLLDWMPPLHTITWDRGTKGVANKVNK